MEFIEAPAFTRHLSDYLNDDEYQHLQARKTKEAPVDGETGYLY